jgi:hypothetical protein
MSAATYNILAEQGATFALSLLYTDTAGDPIDLTTYTAEMHVRLKASTVSTITELSSGDSTITLGGAAGTILLAIDAATTETFTAGKYVYDLELYNGAVVTRLIEGTFTIKAEVTRI